MYQQSHPPSGGASGTTASNVMDTRRWVDGILFGTISYLIGFVLFGLLSIWCMSSALSVHRETAQNLDENVTMARAAWASKDACAKNGTNFVCMDCARIQRSSEVDPITEASILSYGEYFTYSTAENKFEGRWVSLLISKDAWLEQQRFIYANRDTLFLSMLLLIWILATLLQCSVPLWLWRKHVELTERKKLLSQLRPLDDFFMNETYEHDTGKTKTTHTIFRSSGAGSSKLPDNDDEEAIHTEPVTESIPGLYLQNGTSRCVSRTPFSTHKRKL